MSSTDFSVLRWAGFNMAKLPIKDKSWSRHDLNLHTWTLNLQMFLQSFLQVDCFQIYFVLALLQVTSGEVCLPVRYSFLTHEFSFQRKDNINKWEKKQWRGIWICNKKKIARRDINLFWMYFPSLDKALLKT